jgi:Holliday junction resolvasome RuvABC endonuclease subunit
MPADKILALDPSSAIIGWAIAEPGGANPRVLDLGLLRGGAGRLWTRIGRLCDASEELVQKVRPTVVVVEVTSGLCYRKERSQTLSWLAFAQGAVVATVNRHARVRVVQETEWTGKGRRVPKEKRAAQVAHWCAPYRQFAPRDRGHDAADAVGLAAWYLDTLAAERLRARAAR